MSSLLAPFLVNQRWFGGKNRRMTRARLVDHATLRGAENALLAIAEVTYADKSRERYFVPLAVTYGERSATTPPLLRSDGVTVHDAFEDDGFCRALLRAIGRAAEVQTSRGGTFTFESRAGPLPRHSAEAPVRVRLLDAEQSNTSVVYDESLILKAYRRPQSGLSPEVEIAGFLAEHTTFQNVPPLAGRLEYRGPDGIPLAVGLLHRFVPNDGDGWTHTLRSLAALMEAAGAGRSPEPPEQPAYPGQPVVPEQPAVPGQPIYPEQPVCHPERSEGSHADHQRGAGQHEILRSAQDDSILRSAQDDMTVAQHDMMVAVRDRSGPNLASLAELGRVTASLHLALASISTHRDFAPEPITLEDILAWRAAISTRLDRAFGRLRDSLDQQLNDSVRTLAGQVLAAEGRLRRTIDGLDTLQDAVKTRYHGDYHLGQVLKTANGWVILDFEGEPLRPLAERRARHTPLKDVAGLLRSLSYARYTALRSAGSGTALPSPGSPSVDRPATTERTWMTPSPGNQQLMTWEHLARRAFLDAYLGRTRAARARFLPRSDDALQRALAALELDKALYELEYELDNRPDWLAIPLAALAESGQEQP